MQLLRPWLLLAFVLFLIIGFIGFHQLQQRGLKARGKGTYRVDETPFQSTLVAFTSTALEDGRRISFAYPRAWGSPSLVIQPEDVSGDFIETPRRLTVSFTDLPQGASCPGDVEVSLLDPDDLLHPRWGGYRQQAERVTAMATGTLPATASNMDPPPRLLPLTAVLRWPTHVNLFRTDHGPFLGIRYVAAPLQGLELTMLYQAILVDDAQNLAEISTELDCGLLPDFAPQTAASSLQSGLASLPTDPRSAGVFQELDDFVRSVHITAAHE